MALPDDLIEEIFTFLPSKSVGRCRFLSRTWSAALSSDYFARRHFHAANNRRGGVLLLMGTPAGSTGAVGGAPPPIAGSPARALADLGALRMVTHQCRGLLILQAIATGAHYVRNPSTGQTAALPAEPPGSYGMPSLGLGFDESTGEHKIVRIYAGRDWDKAGPDVYVPGDSTTGAGAFWRLSSRNQQRQPPPPSPEYREIDQAVPSVYMQGRIYWLAHKRIYGPYKATIIISYSISDETLDTIPAPPAIGSLGWFSRNSLVELGGDLCLFSPRRDNGADRKCQFNLWRLTRGHGAESSAWELLYRIILPTLPAPENGGWVNSHAWAIPFPTTADEEEEDRHILVAQSITTGDNAEGHRAGSAKMFACKLLTEEMTEKLFRGDHLVEEMSENFFQASDLFLAGAALCQETLVSPPGLRM